MYGSRWAANSGERKFAKLIAEKAKRVVAVKKNSKKLMRMPPTPRRETLERLTRKIWEFGEELRAYSLGDGAAG